MENYLYIQFEQGGYMYFQTPDVRSILNAVQMFTGACSSINLDITNIKISLLELRNESGYAFDRVCGETLNVYDWLQEIQSRNKEVTTVTDTSYHVEEVTEEKFLGKIISAEFGLHKDYPFYGLFLEFSLPSKGKVEGGNFVNISKECCWDDESERQEAITKNAEFVAKVLKDANCGYVSELKNKPVEVTIKGNTFKSFRILTEVL